MTDAHQLFWNRVATEKVFHDPFYLEQLTTHVPSDANIVEYGCGYGRLQDVLWRHGFRRAQGFDTSTTMIERGMRQFPHLSLQHIRHAALPVIDQSADGVILSTVLCCVPDTGEQREIVEELKRILKPGGVAYVADFLLTPAHYQSKYEAGEEYYGEWGVYKTSEGGVVRHHTQDYIDALFKDFRRAWYLEQPYVTMNGNPVLSFHGIYQLKL